VFGIVFTDLVTGVLIGLAVSFGFILHGNMRRPMRCSLEKHLRGPVLRIELASHVTFLNRGALTLQLEQCLPGQHVMIDARNTHSIDLDVLDLIDDFAKSMAPVRGVKVSLIGFQGRFPLNDQYDDIDNADHRLQQDLSPDHVLQILRDGNERFYTGRRLPRDLGREVRATSKGQFPLAVVLSCIDSRSPAEILFDLGLGDIFSVRIAGQVAREKVMASIEYACAVAGTKLVVVLGHTQCGAVNAAVNAQFFPEKLKGIDCDHLDVLLNEIQRSIDPSDPPPSPNEVAEYADRVARQNVLRTVRKIRNSSRTLDRLVNDGRIIIIGGMYDVSTGRVEFLTEVPAEPALVSV
jgi:carbonic anhydrase/SulP family sulfate permease